MSTVQRVTLKDLAREIEDFSAYTLEQQQAAVVSGLYRSLPMLAERSPIDQGVYASSWAVDVTPERASIGNFAPHAPIIEVGARPFTPPIAPLLAWAKRVLQDPSQPPEYSDRVWALAKGAQRKIAAEGIAPRMVLTSALPDIIGNIKAELDRLELR